MAAAGPLPTWYRRDVSNGSHDGPAPSQLGRPDPQSEVVRGCPLATGKSGAFAQKGQVRSAAASRVRALCRSSDAEPSLPSCREFNGGAGLLCLGRMISQQQTRSPSPRSPSPRSPSPRVLRGRTVLPSPRAVEQIDAQVSVRRRSRRSAATPMSASARSSFGSPSLSFQPEDSPGRRTVADVDPEEDLPTVRDSPQQPARRRPRGSGERAAERKSIRKAMPKPPGLGIMPGTAPSRLSATQMSRSFGSGFAGWRAWAWVGALLVIVLCRSLGTAERVPIRPSNAGGFAHHWGADDPIAAALYHGTAKDTLLELSRVCVDVREAGTSPLWPTASARGSV